MPKQIKGLAGRTPPELSKDHGPIEAWIPKLMPVIQPLTAGVDELICRTLPGATFAVHRHHALYGLPGLGCVIELAAYHVSVNVLFHGGADFDAPPPLGNVDRTRYVKLYTMDELERPDLKDWIRQAGLVEGWT